MSTMFTTKTSNFIIRNKNFFEKNSVIAKLVFHCLLKKIPLAISDIGIKTRFTNSYALQSEKNSSEFKKIMYKLESYLGTGPMGFKKYWEYPWALANLRLESGVSIMDAGCGKSPVQFLLADLGMQVTGVDLFENVEWHGIDRSLAKRFGSRIEYYRESLENLRFPDNVFDRISCLSVLEHIRHKPIYNEKMVLQTKLDKELQYSVVSELVRVLKPGGLIVITIDFNIPRNDCILESNIDIENILGVPEIEMFGNRCPEPFPGEENFDPYYLIYNGDIYIENYLGTLQTSIGLVLKKKVISKL